MKRKGKILALGLAAIIAVSGLGAARGEVMAAETPSAVQNMEKTASQAYVEDMGSGWNLGNSFDGFEADLDKEDPGETAWGNPTVTQDLLTSVKEKGYKSIRIPFTVYRRYTVNENAGDGEYKYVINEEWLKRYKEVVDWAVGDGFTVMINIHHDSWIWLKNWNGDKTSEEYRMYSDFWKQMAEYFKNEPEQVCFETINEPQFTDDGIGTAQDKLDIINQTAYDIIRGVEENKERMIVMPSMYTKIDEAETDALYKMIKGLNDPNVIATVHYYCEWVYSANLGKTGFDEALWDDYSPRKAVESMMSRLKTTFIDNGIGVIVGEYGLLGYDTSEGCLQEGEEMKYYEDMNYLAGENGVCLMFWDNGSGIDRNTAGHPWKKQVVGELLEASMKGRSSYATDLDTIYFTKEVTENVEIPLTLNGNTFTGIEGLTQDQDYTYDDETKTVVLKKDFVNQCLKSAASNGQVKELIMHFSSGADWHQYLVKCATPEVKSAAGTRQGITVPLKFNGDRVRRIMTYEKNGKVGPNSDWWNYLKYDEAFVVDTQNETITFTSVLFGDSSVKDGIMKAKVEFYSGASVDIWFDIQGDKVTCSAEYAQGVENIQPADLICLYAGETEIPDQYLNLPDGATVYGTYCNDSEMMQLNGWPASMTFDTKSHEEFTQAGIQICYYDEIKYHSFTFGIKDAPDVKNIEVKEADKTKIEIDNLATDAKVSYQSDDSTIASVDENGVVTGQRAGSTKIIVTVTQYGRTDRFEGTVTVKEVTKSEETVKPGETTKPEENVDTVKPGETTKPEETAKSEETTKNEETTGSDDTVKAEETVKPEETRTTEVSSETKSTGRVVTEKNVKWEFEGEAPDSFDPKVTIGSAIQKLSERLSKGKLPENMKYTTVSFAYDGQLPGKVKVTLDLSDAGFAENATVYLYYYNPEKDRFELTDSATYANGQAVFTMTHCSDYLVTDTRLPESYVQSAETPDTGDDTDAAGWMLLIFAGSMLLLSAGKRWNLQGTYR